MLPLNANQIPVLYKKAVGLMQAGKPKAAVQAFQDLVRMAPNRGEFEFHIGQILYAIADYRRAVLNFVNAADKAPGEKAVWTAYADALAALGDEDAIADARKVLNKSPLDARERKAIRKRMEAVHKASKRTTTGVTSQQIQVLLDGIEAGRALEVAQETQRLLDSNPKNEILHNVHGISLASSKQHEAAEAAFKAALAIDPTYPEAHAYYGEMLVELERREDALKHLKLARKAIPNSPIVLGNLGRLYGQLGDLEDSLDCLNALLSQDSRMPLGLFSRALTYQSKQNHKAALKDLDKLAKVNPDYNELHAYRARSLDGDEALAAADLALSRDENSLVALTAKATLMSQQGKFDDANDILMHAIQRGGAKGGLYGQIAVSRKFTADDPLIDEMVEVWNNDALDTKDRSALGFALTKAMEDTKQYDKVWPYLKTACDLVTQAYPYNRAQLGHETRSVKEFFSDLATSRIGTTGYEKDETVFVSGLPRSGTTLVEQIVSSHSAVTGTGELGIFTDYAVDVIRPYGMKNSHVSDIPDADFLALGKRYHDEVHSRYPDAVRTADKSIGVQQLSGMAWLALPNSKMVVLRRDPRDNLFSIYKNRFANGLHLYSYDLETLVEVYRNFLETLDFWREIAPDRLYEIQYEELVENPEEETRRLLEFCGLEWEDACLNFHQNKRKIDTLSLYQVRQPMYKSSVAAWRRYEEHLGPLLDGLKDLQGLRD